MAIVKTGTLTPTAASTAQNVTLGFVPCAVDIYNVTSGDELHWTDDLADGYGFKRVAAGTGATITTGGITPLGDDEGLTVSASDTTSDGDTTTMTQIRGFQIGTDADINVCGEQLIYIAHGLGHDGD